MAVAATIPSGATVASTAAADSYATSSWSGAGATRTYICFAQASFGGTGATRDATVTGNGLTWTPIGSRGDWDSLAVPVRSCQMFRARGTASTGATTADWGAGTDGSGAFVIVVECDGVDGTTNQGVVQSVTTPSDASASPHTLSLGAFASPTNGTLACFVEDSNSLPTAEGGYSSLAAITYNTPNSYAVAEFLASADTSPSLTASTINWCGMAVELAQLVTAAPGPSARRRNHTGVLIDTRGWD